MSEPEHINTILVRVMRNLDDPIYEVRPCNDTETKRETTEKA